MDRRFIILIAGVIAAGAGTVAIAAMVAPTAVGASLAGPVLLILALLSILAHRRRRG